MSEQKPLTPSYTPPASSLTLTAEQLEQIIASAVKAAQPAPDPDVVAARERKQKEDLENRKLAGIRAKAEADQQAAVKARCNHRGGCEFVEGIDGKPKVTQGRGTDTSLVLNKGSKWPSSMEDSFVICQRCTSVFYPDSPVWQAFFEEAA